MANNADVIIIGAGVSGLSAAHDLRKNKVKFLILEARDRVGGRLKTAKFGKGEVDLGGEWIGPSQPRVNALVKELGIRLFSNYTKGRKTLQIGKRVSFYRGLIPKVAPQHLIVMQIGIWYIDYLARRIDKIEPWNSKNADKLDSTTVESWQRKFMPSRKGRDLLNAALRVIFGSEAKDLSLLHFLYYIKLGGGMEKMIDAESGSQHDRLDGGAQALAIELAKLYKKEIKLNSPVTNIEQTAKGTTVYCGSRKYTAKKIIMAIPPALMGRISYNPELPPGKHQLYQRTPMASLIKIYINYDTPFWRDQDKSGEIVSSSGPICVGFDNVSEDGKQPAILLFVGGDHARQWINLEEEERQKIIIAELVKFFGDQANDYTGYLEQNWMSETYSGGGPIGYFTTNTLSQFGMHLRTPFKHIHYAGTETARDFLGFIEGAIEAGQRAAEEIIGALKR